MLTTNSAAYKDHENVVQKVKLAMLESCLQQERPRLEKYSREGLTYRMRISSALSTT